MAEFQGVGSPSSELLRMIEQGSAIHEVQATASGFLVRARPGRDAEFARLAERILTDADTFTAFGEPNEGGGYVVLHITPHE